MEDYILKQYVKNVRMMFIPYTKNEIIRVGMLVLNIAGNKIEIIKDESIAIPKIICKDLLPVQPYLVRIDNDWKEGDCIYKNAPIYYNGDYGEKRSSDLYKIIAKPDQIGLVFDFTYENKDGEVISSAEGLYGTITDEYYNKIYHNKGLCQIEVKEENSYNLKLMGGQVLIHTFDRLN